MSFGSGRLIRGTFATWARQAPRLLALSMGTSCPLALALFVAFSGEQLPDAARGLILIAALPVHLALRPFERGAASFLVVCSLEGRRVRLREAVTAGLEGFARVAGVQLVLLAVVLPATALVVPGLLWGTGWSAALPAATLERLPPLAALRRSWALSRGYRWRILGGLAVVHAVVVAGLVAEVLTFGALILASRETTPLFDGVAMATIVVVTGILVTLPPVAFAVTYQGLHAAKEGRESLASIFS